MKRLFRIGASRPEASTSAAKSSAGTPSSGVTFVDNSCGASAAVVELSNALGDALGQIDISGKDGPRCNLA